MSKKAIFFFLMGSVLLSCQRDNPDVKNAEAVGEKKLIQVDSAKNSDVMKANSAPANDVKAIASSALRTLQTAYNNAKGKVPGVDDVTVLVDDNLNLIIENKSGLTTTTTMANLKALDPDMAHIEIIPNYKEGEFPGFRIKTLPGQPKVTVATATGKKEVDFLEIKLAERMDVQHSLSALTMAAEAAQSKLNLQ